MELSSQPVAGFVGVNLRRDRLSLSEIELARAINADLHTFLGSLTLRLGTQKQLTSALGTAATRIIRQLAKINGQNLRYRVAGRSVFRNTTQVGNETLSANLFTHIATMRPLLDTSLWAFFADDATMTKDDGTNYYKWGIAAPTVAPTLYQGGSGSVTNGVYSVEYTYARKTSDGKLAHESNPSPASANLTITASSLSAIFSILVTGIQASTDPQVTHVRVYRTFANGVSYQFALEFQAGALGGIAIAHTFESAYVTGTTWKFTTLNAPFDDVFGWEGNLSTGLTTDTTPSVSTAASAGVRLTLGDGALGTQVETDNDPPPLASWNAVNNDTMFLVRDALNPHYVWYSKRSRPEAFPLLNFFEVGNPNDPLVALIPWLGFLTAFTGTTKYRVFGSAIEGFTVQEAISHRGTPAPNTCIPSQYGIVFAARDGVFASSIISEDQALAEDILPLFQGETVNGYSPINWAQAQKMSAAAYKGRLFISYPSGISTEPDMVMVLSVATKKWFFYDRRVRSILVEEDVDQLVSGSTDGFVYIMEDGVDDAGSGISLDAQTRDYWGDSPEVRKLFRYFKVDADCDGDSLAATFFVDGKAVATKAITGARTRLLQNLPGALGYSWRIQLSYNGTRRPKIYGVDAKYLPLEAA